MMSSGNAAAPRGKGREEARPRVEAASHNNILGAALDAATRGIPVLPACWTDTSGNCLYHDDCGHPGKRPLYRRSIATTDPRIIGMWWRRHPDAGIKWVLPAGLIAIDVDVRKGGDLTVTNLVTRYGPIPKTCADENGHEPGGGHYILRTSYCLNQVVTIGEGVEVFGVGTELVMPPSPHARGGRRRWQPGCSPAEVELAECPRWLVDRVRRVLAEGALRRGHHRHDDDPAAFVALFETVGIRHNGRRRSVVHCPFHRDSHASLSIDWDGCRFRCHASSCGVRGYLPHLRELMGVAS